MFVCILASALLRACVVSVCDCVLSACVYVCVCVFAYVSMYLRLKSVRCVRLCARACVHVYVRLFVPVRVLMFACVVAPLVAVFLVQYVALCEECVDVRVYVCMCVDVYGYVYM